MPRLTSTAVCVFAAASLVLTANIEHRARQQLAANSQKFEEQAAQLAQLTSENSQLSSRGAAPAPEPALAGHDLVELLQLRSEATRLREFAAGKSRLETANAKLRDSALKSQQDLAAARALPNYWPTDQLAFAGYADPQSTLKSLFAAMKEGDLTAVTNCFTPKAGPDFEASMKQAGDDPAKAEARIKSWFSDFLSSADGFHIVTQTATDPDKVDITYSIDGIGAARTSQFTFRKFGSDWKISQ